jgi:outer membrane receptor protein involved in Fe transport
LRDQSPTSGRHPKLTNQSPQRVEGPLPDNSLGRWNWNGNLTAEFHPFQLRLGGHSTRDAVRVYVQDFAMFNAARMPRLEEQTDSYYFKAMHTLGPKTFYTLTTSYFRNEFEFGDNVWFDNLEAYGDISRNPQLRAPGVNPAVSDLEARFAKAGAVFNSYRRHQFTVWNLQAAFNHKTGSTHTLQAGMDYRYNTIRIYSIAPFNIAQTRAANPALSDDDVYIASFAQNIGYDILGKKELDSGRNGAKHPVLAAVFLQDQIKVQNVVLRLGLRWDYFDPATLIFRDPLLIVFDQNGRIAGRVYRDASGRYASGVPTPQDQTGVLQLIEAKTHSRLNPRANMAFAVTDRTVLRARFGRFTQPPEFNLLATNYDLLGNILQGGGLAASNSTLKPIGTTAYEIGLRQQLDDKVDLDAAFFYRTARDLIALQSAETTPVPYTTFVNDEESTAKGLAITVYWRPRRGISTNAAYTLQSATGTDVVNTFSNINWLGNPSIFPTAAASTTATPLAFDQRPTLILNADFRVAKGEGPRWLGIRPFSELGLNVLLIYGSGFPYTSALSRSAIFSAGPGGVSQPVAEINSSRTPATYSLDAKLDKSFTLAGVRWNIYFWTINLLGRQNVTNVYGQTGEPDDDGFLQTPSGMEFAALDPTGNAAAYYRARISNPFNFGAPRQFRLGLRFDMK